MYIENLEIFLKDCSEINWEKYLWKKNKKKNAEGGQLLSNFTSSWKISFGKSKLFINSQNKIRGCPRGHIYAPLWDTYDQSKNICAQEPGKSVFLLKVCLNKKKYLLCDLEKIGKKGIFWGGRGRKFWKKNIFFSTFVDTAYKTYVRAWTFCNSIE